jgi:cytochrome c-type biogenesis protein CcmH/NrfG
MHFRCTLVIALLVVVAPTGRADRMSPRAVADSALMALRTVPGTASRNAARFRLEQIASEAPGDREVWHALAEGRLLTGSAGLAREAWEHVLALDSTDASAWEGVGDTWKHDWLLTLDSVSSASAVHAYYRSVTNAGRRTRSWIQLGTLLHEGGDRTAAAVAASRALESAPTEPNAMLLGALMAYGGGRLALADSLFRAAVPHLPSELAARFEDVRPLLAPAEAERYDEMGEEARSEFQRKFWSATDPDPTARWNLARLEFHARVAHVLLLLEGRPPSVWDARSEMLVRYGRPGAAAHQPRGAPVAWAPMRPTGFFIDEMVGKRPIGDVPPPVPYPLHTQVMSYPQFGIRALLVDYGLDGRYELSRESNHDPEPHADTARVRALGLDVTGGGRGVFPRLPPLATPRELAVTLSRFEGGIGPRLLAHVRVPAEPADSLVATLAVFDSSEREIRRAAAPLAPSGCDAAAFRSGEFAFDLPAGRYRIAFSVADRKGGRGVERCMASLVSPGAALAISDLVPTCSTPDLTLDPATVRLDPALPAAIQGDESLRAYFEVYRLHPGTDGLSLFEYEYEVHDLGVDRRPWYRRWAALGQRPARVSVRSSQSGPGPMRRQFIHVPGAELSSGRYRLTLRVRDRLNGAVAQRTIDFQKAR